MKSSEIISMGTNLLFKEFFVMRHEPGHSNLGVSYYVYIKKNERNKILAMAFQKCWSPMRLFRTIRKLLIVTQYIHTLIISKLVLDSGHKNPPLHWTMFVPKSQGCFFENLWHQSESDQSLSYKLRGRSLTTLTRRGR